MSTCSYELYAAIVYHVGNFTYMYFILLETGVTSQMTAVTAQMKHLVICTWKGVISNRISAIGQRTTLCQCSGIVMLGQDSGI